MWKNVLMTNVSARFKQYTEGHDGCCLRSMIFLQLEVVRPFRRTCRSPAVPAAARAPVQRGAAAAPRARGAGGKYRR